MIIKPGDKVRVTRKAKNEYIINQFAMSALFLNIMDKVLTVDRLVDDNKAVCTRDGYYGVIPINGLVKVEED